MSEERLRWHYEEQRNWLYNAFSLVVWVAMWLFSQGLLVFFTCAYSFAVLGCVIMVANSEYYPFSWGMFLSPWLWLGFVGGALGLALLALPFIPLMAAVCMFAWQMAGKHSRMLPIVALLASVSLSVYAAWDFCDGGVAGVVSSCLLSVLAFVLNALIGAFVWKFCTPSE